MYAGGAFSAFACHGRHAMRAPAQAACRQPAQLNVPLVADRSEDGCLLLRRTLTLSPNPSPMPKPHPNPTYPNPMLVNSL